jgi:hypothetical protein
VQRHSTRKYLLSAAFLVAIGAAACGREEVTHFRVAKLPGSPATDAPATAASLVGDAAAAPAGAPLRWTLPEGWSEEAGGAMRRATLRPPVSGSVDASVVVLAGAAGGELANVNRWRGQIGLSPLDEAGLAAARQVLRTRAGPLKVYDFTSQAKPESRLVAGLAESEGRTWFVKITGDADAVGAAREDFMKLLGSLRFDESH